MPARSVLTVTPLTALSEPTALSTGCQVCPFTTTVVTAEGGGANFECSAIAARTREYLKKPMPATNTRTAASMMSIRFHIGQKIREYRGIRK